ncbi:MAG: hypothetical protein ACREN6_06170 [Gemmatimonadaceae bacterium]
MKDGLISSIIKYYDLGDGSDIADVYTAAMRDARREPFEPCVTSPVKLRPADLNGEISRIKTVCGRYELDFDLSSKDKNGLGTSRTSIAVIVGLAVRPH